jgi:hypothetical protein
MTLDGETTNTEVVDLEKLYNFVVDNILIWVHLASQMLISKTNEDNTMRKNISYGHKSVWVEWLEE